MILLDTHVLVWLDAANEKLGRKTLSLIDEALHQDELAVSAISFWEVAMLERKADSSSGNESRVGDTTFSSEGYSRSRLTV